MHEPSLDQTLGVALRRLRSGIEVEESYRRLDAALRPRLVAYFRAHGFGADDADDLVQKTLARVYQGVTGLREDEKLMAWLFTIARNVRLTARQRAARETELFASNFDLESAAAAAPEGPVVEGTIRSERLATVRAAIESLPGQQRQCLLLRLREELSYEEIARTLALSAHTVRNHLAQARIGLRRTLGSDAVGDFQI